VAAGVLACAVAAGAQSPPALTQPVNDFARIIDAGSAAAMDRAIRTLQAATGDVVAVATVETIAPSADIREYAVRMFENQGKGIGQKGRDNGLLVVLAVKERQVRVEVGYDLESFVTDGYAGAVSRDTMTPFFRQGQFGEGLNAGVARLIGRIAEGRHVTLDGSVTAAPAPAPARTRFPRGLIVVIGIILYVVVTNRTGGGGGTGIRSGGGRWTSGVGPFGGGFGGGLLGGGGFGRGGGGGGGFGGFGGGGSGGGGGGASW
jgi:uncharacterized protein